MRSTRAWRLPAILLSMAVVAGACGEDDAVTPGDDPGTTEPGPAAAPNQSDGTLKFGTLFPETGTLASFGPPEAAAAQLAVQDLNAAGGVLGRPVEITGGDSGDTSTNIANQTVDRLLSQNVDVIVGAASSGVSFTVIDKITGAGVVQYSPANTSPRFTDYDDDGLYFRTAPSDVLQGRILGEHVIEEGNATVGIIALQDPYGEGLAENVASTIEDSGGEVVATEIYDPQAQNFDAEIQALVSADPDAIVVIGFVESGRIISTMIEQGIGPDDKNVYSVDGNTTNDLGEGLEPGTLEGISGTIPGGETSEEFRRQLVEVDPELRDFLYAGETYDAFITSALAAEVAGSDAGRDIAEVLADVTRDGEKCTTFTACKTLIDAGTDIDYDGVSGPIELSDAGDPTEASIGIYTFGPDNFLTDDVIYRSGTL